MVSPRFNGLRFVAHHEHRARDRDFEMSMRTKCLLNKPVGRWNSVEVLELPSRIRPAVYVPVLPGSVKWEPIRLPMLPSSSSFAYSSSLKLRGSEADKANI